ncbi:MAG: NADP-dependent phosphogluconate dehydrogenase [Fimbriimonadaceae bacterium]|nr:NADP-dependent phosphogluconate dehydrogenase [Fimbriimonadaceae bacterium]
MPELYQFGMVGLGTMGRSLSLNVADHGYSVIGLATSEEKAASFANLAEGRKLTGVCGPESFIGMLEKPRIIMILVPAGDPVDAVIAELSPWMEPGDFFIEGGNSHYTDTERRLAQLAAKGLGFIGIGVSGGEEGARHGPSMMAGGTLESYSRVQPILEAVAAKFDGDPCVGLLGKGGAGHYVKMVHNGIEYALMQLIAEVYDLLHRGLGMTNAEIADQFEEWTAGPFGGFLTQITSDVLRMRDEGGQDLVDLVLDKAKQKGTGKWTSQDAFDLGIPIPTIDAAVSARQLSGMKDQRVANEHALGTLVKLDGPSFLKSKDMITTALHQSFVIAYAQGISLLEAAGIEHGMDIDVAQSAKVWRAGCIIRSALLEPIRAVVASKQAGQSLLVAEEFRDLFGVHEESLPEMCALMIELDIPGPATFSSLAYWTGMRTARLPANLIQAQRDYFGAHTYERIDRPGTFHSEWGPN